MVISARTDAVGVYQILPEDLAYQPLGVKIRRYEYRVPERFIVTGGTIRGSVTVIRHHLDVIRRRVAEGRFVPEDAGDFFDVLGITTGNLEGFRALDILLWREFEETYRVIAGELLKTNGHKEGEIPSEFHETGLRRAEDFLRPLAYRVILGDEDHVWGYATPGVNALKLGQVPRRCSFRYEEMDAERVIHRLIEDLDESFGRRDDPRPMAPAVDQCSEPNHPARYRTMAAIDGPAEAAEQSEVVFTSAGSVAQLEYGDGYEHVKRTPVQFDWDIVEYTCHESAPLETEIRGSSLVLKTPKVLDDNCVATVRLTMIGPYYEQVTARHEVRILNTINEPPEIVKIRGPRRSRGLGPATLTARVRDPNGDPVRFAWRRAEGPHLRFDGATDAASIKFYHDRAGRDRRSAVELAVTDEPRGLRPGTPATVVERHVLTIAADGEAVSGGLPSDPKRKGAQRIAQATGGDPFRIATPPTLEDALIDAATPDEPVGRIDVVLLIDSSGSMVDDIKTLKGAGPALLEALKKKIKDGDPGKVRIGVASYVDDKFRVHAHLTVINDTIMVTKVDEVVSLIEGEGGGRETIWDALYLTIRGERWVRGSDAHRAVIYLTDEEGDPGKLGKSEADVARLASRAGVAVEPIFLMGYFDVADVLRDIYRRIDEIDSDDRKGDAIRDTLHPMVTREIERAPAPDEAGRRAEDYIPHISGTISGVKDTRKKLAIAEELLVPQTADGNPAVAHAAQRAYADVLISIPDEAERVQRTFAFLDQISGVEEKLKTLVKLEATVEDPGLVAEILRDRYLPLLEGMEPSASSRMALEHSGWFISSLKKLGDQRLVSDLAARLYPLIRGDLLKIGFLDGAASVIGDQEILVSWINIHYWPAISAWVNGTHMSASGRVNHTVLTDFAKAIGNVKDPAMAMSIARATLLTVWRGGGDALIRRAAMQAYIGVILGLKDVKERERQIRQLISEVGDRDEKLRILGYFGETLPDEAQLVKFIREDFYPVLTAAYSAGAAGPHLGTFCGLLDKAAAGRRRLYDEMILPWARKARFDRLGDADFVAFKAYQDMTISLPGGRYERIELAGRFAGQITDLRVKLHFHYNFINSLEVGQLRFSYLRDTYYPAMALLEGKTPEDAICLREFLEMLRSDNYNYTLFGAEVKSIAEKFLLPIIEGKTWKNLSAEMKEMVKRTYEEITGRT